MQEQKHGTTLKCRNRQITLTHYITGAKSAPPCPCRGDCEGWNERIQYRLKSFIENFRQDFTVFGTLTYPAVYPRDGKTVKNDWRAFVERLRRTGWLETGSIVWVIEFQKRGAPHFHFIATDWIRKDWVATAWAQVTSGDHRSCSRIEAIKVPEAAGNYMAKYLLKSDQKLVPEEFEGIGRMWGCSGPKILRDLPRVPVVAADAKGRLPRDLEDIINTCSRRYGVRIVNTLGGYVIYGHKEEIKHSWRYLLANIATRDLEERGKESTRHPTAVG
jgi:hypothetical protein